MILSRFNKRNARALTFAELSIVVGIFSFVGIFISYLMLEVGRQTRTLTSELPAQQNAYRALDYARLRVLSADYTSLALSNSNQTISFDNPVEGSNSSLTFGTTTVGGETQNVLIFDPDTATSGDEVNYGRDVTGDFEILNNRGTVRITVSTDGIDRNNNVVVYTFSDEILARN